MTSLEELLTRRVAKILPSKAGLIKLIQKKKRLRLYQGFDPTGGRLHLGHTVGLRKLMEFAQAGHEVIFLFGTGTVLVGDPSQRDTGRKLISQTEIDINIKGWQDQVSPIVDFTRISIKQNGDWLVPLTLKDIISIASNISAIQLFKRETFQNRLKRGDTVWYHETMYPLLQGYDSVVMDVDLEIGGTDQEFNMLIGRELQYKMRKREKYILTVPMILGTDGKTMSKTSGNCIFLDDTPNDKFAKIMALIDDQIIPYFKLVTATPDLKIHQIENDLSSATLHPIDAKKLLASIIVAEWHGQTAAKQTQTYFETTFQKRQTPTNLPTVNLKPGRLNLLELLKKSGLIVSGSQLKRVIKEGGVEYNQKKITDPKASLTPKTGDIIRFGKHQFFRLDVH